MALLTGEKGVKGKVPRENNVLLHYLYSLSSRQDKYKETNTHTNKHTNLETNQTN